MRQGTTVILLTLLSLGCNSDPNEKPLFESILPEASGLHFVNKVENTEDFNIFNYRNFYNGAGAAIGDINNDGLSDIFLTSNMGENKLFLNKGNFKFEDITEEAGVGGTKGWSTGVVMVDINADGWLDIYVCNAGFIKGENPENELFVNNGPSPALPKGEGVSPLPASPKGAGEGPLPTSQQANEGGNSLPSGEGWGGAFTEKAAEYNLDEKGYTTHAAFFDYDLDGDLDCYVLNNSFMPVNTLNYSNKRELYAEDWPVRDFLKGGGDKLLRNDFIPPPGGTKGGFTDVSREAGIYGSLIGFGLGITVGDINGDNLPDMYVSNDFFERDYLYINQGDGTFSEDIETRMEHLSHASMGADMADINNDGFPEIFVTEMLPQDEYRLKTTTVFEDYKIYQLKLDRDFYYQYMQNTLQLNNRDQTFSDIAYFSGVAASDWSWGALMFDADNDGYRDIYVCNGIYQDVIDQDFINFFADEVVQKMVLTGQKEEMKSVIDKMPSHPLANKAFRNRGDPGGPGQALTFEDMGSKWGFGAPTWSNGAAYGDLDNDGDPDLVVNNVNQEALLYRNTAETLRYHHLTVALTGTGANTFAIGSKVFVYYDGEVQTTQLVPSRGFQSSVDYKMVFGLGEAAAVDSLVVIWPDRRKTVMQHPPVDTLLTIAYATANGMANNNPYQYSNAGKAVVEKVPNTFQAHREDPFIDFYKEGLVMRMVSREGPAAAVAGVDGDGLDDVFLGGASGQAGQLYLQKNSGAFAPGDSSSFGQEAGFEDTAARFFDADGDGDADLFVGSGGNNYPMASRPMQDRIYLNDGKGNFTLHTRALPINGFNTSVAVPLDFDGDGDLDLFVGSRSIPSQYGIPPGCFIYQNDGAGNFSNVTKTAAPELERPGMVTGAMLVNLVDDEREELVVIGEWMSPMIFKIENGQFQKVQTNLADYSGWWYALAADDVDGDGDNDLILGNRGENFYFTGTKEQPAKLWIYDFDGNSSPEKIITRRVNGRDMPLPMKKELTEQIVSLKKQNLKYAEYATKSIQELFGADVLKKALELNGTYFKSAVALNEGDGQFTLIPLPDAVQFSSVNAICSTDLNGDGKNDLLLAGNDSGFLPQFSKLDASFGHVLLNRGGGQYERLENRESGFFIRGEVRGLTPLTIKGEKYLLAAVNDQQPALFKLLQNAPLD
jgi:enediyne biosynthesis protein E4